jgi:hypothetical protein
MGEAKRRKDTLGGQYGKEQPISRFLPITQAQADQFIKLTIRGSWIGIGLLVVWWAVVRIVGPNLGWWTVN